MQNGCSDTGSQQAGFYQFLSGPDCCEHRPAAVIFTGDRRPEKCHKSVSEKLVDRTLVTVHFRQTQFEKAADDTVERFGPQLFRQMGGIRNVTE